MGLDSHEPTGYNTHMNANTIRKQLSKNGVCFIRFEKMDGTIRNMICTTDEELIPKQKRPTGRMNYDMDSQVRVFDIVAQEWRSMKPDNVIEVMDYDSTLARELLHA